MTAAVSVDEAYARCEAITRAQAANFFYGIRLLPGRRRRAMCAVYAFARRVDDIGDGTLAPHDKLMLLDEQERALGGDADSADAVILALADAHRHFQLPPDALPELIEGVRMDVRGVAYETFDELVVYCRRVAGAVGRACLAIFAMRDAGGCDRTHTEALADDLGVALQLTNILRDLREDAHNDRVYLPAQDLARFGVVAAHPSGSSPASSPPVPAATAAQVRAALARAAVAPPGAARLATAPLVQSDDDATRAPVSDGRELERLTALVRFEARRAGAWFDRGMALTALLDRRSAACVLAMAGIYERLLARIEHDPAEVLSRRVSLPAHEKAWVAARGMLGART